MRGVWTGLAAIVGFSLAFVVTILVGIEATVSSECDGPCFSKWDEVFYVACGFGVACAVGFGALAWALLTERRAP
jgi:hypothetical protein